ncbi:hypothetical protein OWC48_23775 [Bradyrhizobium sp. Arg816]|nr:hypothetical protein [Bradyrhizobium sp. Arg816]MDI3563408.1 hypothetical protein [Bradyrhizobium sp. Arg816]
MAIILAANPHRVFISRIGRAEVFQPIPPPGPHTHVLPKLLAHRRTHAATEPLPDGWIPCAHLYPAHPLRDQLGRKREFQSQYQGAFQALLERYGEPAIATLKRDVVAAVRAGQVRMQLCSGTIASVARLSGFAQATGRDRAVVFDTDGVACRV